MRDAREILALPPADPDAVRRFGPPTYSEEQVRAYATALVRDLGPTGEEFLEFKEALSDLRSLRAEHRDLNGGGPGWMTRWLNAWVKVDELFDAEDEAAYDRQQEDAHG